MFVPTTIVELGALMTDLEADPSVKVVVFQSVDLELGRVVHGDLPLRLAPFWVGLRNS
jgi:hypothetical protein